MTTGLTGRALDEAVARIVGSYREKCDGRMMEHDTYWICDGCGDVDGSWGEDMPDHERVHGYSTDWSRVPEMLAWLRERGWPVRIVEGRGSVEAHRWYVESYKPSVEKLAMASGSNIPEALARLVVKVAELENKEQA